MTANDTRGSDTPGLAPGVRAFRLPTYRQRWRAAVRILERQDDEIETLSARCAELELRLVTALDLTRGSATEDRLDAIRDALEDVL